MPMPNIFDPKPGVAYYFKLHENQIRRLPKYFNDKVDKERDVSIFTSKKTGRHMYQELHQGWGQVQLTKYSSTPSTSNIYQVQVLVKYSSFRKST